MIRVALRDGLRQVFRFRKLIALFYFVNLVAAFLVAAPIAMLIGTSLGHSLESDRLFLNMDPSWIMETLYQFRFWPATSASLSLGLAAILFLVVNTFLAGGTLALYYREHDAFFSASARYFGRMFRLMLISLLFYGLVFMAANAATKAITYVRESSMQAKLWILLGWGRLAVELFLLGVVNMIFDYAKISIVTDGTRSPLRAVVNGWRFAANRKTPTLAVYWVCAAAGFLALLVYHGMTELIQQQSAAAIIAVLILRQAYTITRILIRLWTWSSELGFYTFNSTMVAPEPPSLGVAE